MLWRKKWLSQTICHRSLVLKHEIQVIILLKAIMPSMYFLTLRFVDLMIVHRNNVSVNVFYRLI